MCGGLECCHTTLNHMACLQGSVLLLRGCWLAGGAYIAWRLSVGSVKRLSHMAGKNRRLKRDLLNVWRGIQVSAWSHFPPAPWLHVKPNCLNNHVDVQAPHLLCEEACVYFRSAEKACSPHRSGSRSCKPWRHQHRSWARLSPRPLCRIACQTPQHHPWQGLLALARAAILLFGSPLRVRPMSANPCVAGVRLREEECLSTITNSVSSMLHEVTMSGMQLPC